MLSLAVCDDDEAIACIVKEYLLKYLGDRFIEHTVDLFYDGGALSDAYKLGKRFDIVYLDIEMGTVSGISVAKEIRNLDRNALLIYISMHETYFIQLFEVEPFRFIKKPISYEQLCDVTQLAYERVIEENVYFEYRYNKIDGKILVRNIIYFESKGRQIRIISTDRIESFYGKLDEVESKLRNSKIPFLRIHKSYYVNFNYIDKISFSAVILLNGKELQISKERRQQIREDHMQIMGEKFIKS